MGRPKTKRGEIADALETLRKTLTLARERWAGPRAPRIQPELDAAEWLTLHEQAHRMRVYAQVVEEFALRRYEELRTS